MAIERLFDPEIADAEARTMLTVGDMYDFVHRTLANRVRGMGETAPDEAQLRSDVLDMIVEETGAERCQLVRNTRFVADLGVT